MISSTLLRCKTYTLRGRIMETWNYPWNQYNKKKSVAVVACVMYSEEVFDIWAFESTHDWRMEFLIELTGCLDMLMVHVISYFIWIMMLEWVYVDQNCKCKRWRPMILGPKANWHGCNDKMKRTRSTQSLLLLNNSKKSVSTTRSYNEMKRNVSHL